MGCLCVRFRQCEVGRRVGNEEIGMRTTFLLGV